MEDLVVQGRINLFIFLAFFYFPLTGTSEKRLSSTRIQWALVSVEKATVYKYANFDSPVIHHFKYSEKILITMKLYKGVGGFGTFYKTKLKNKKIGYITDIEVIPQYIRVGDHLRPNKEFQEFGLRERTKHLEDIYLSRYLGVSSSWVGLTEKWGKKSFTKFVSFFGFRLTGPKFISEQFPWDLEVLINPFLPSYYKDIPLKDIQTVIDHSGFHLQSSLVFNIPLSQTIFRLIYAGLGPCFFFRNIGLETSKNKSYHLKHLRLGMVLQFGLAYRLSENYLIRVEGRYYMEKVSYVATNLSFQKLF